MERKNTPDEKNYLTSPVVAKILQVNNGSLVEIVRHGIVRPLREHTSNGKNLWEPEDIFRAFLVLRLVDEFRTKYKGRHGEYMYDQVGRDILLTRRLKGREILESEEWADVTKKAAKEGLNLLNLKSHTT